jgi:hypothetical protein
MLFFKTTARRAARMQAIRFNPRVGTGAVLQRATGTQMAVLIAFTAGGMAHSGAAARLKGWTIGAQVLPYYCRFEGAIAPNRNNVRLLKTMGQI